MIAKVYPLFTCPTVGLIQNYSSLIGSERSVLIQFVIFYFLLLSNCFHGEWRCRRTSQCGPQKPRSCTVTLNSLGRNVQSDCPKGYWCKVQIPGIPEAGIPEVAMCVPGQPTGIKSVGNQIQSETHKGLCQFPSK